MKTLRAKNFGALPLTQEKWNRVNLNMKHLTLHHPAFHQVTLFKSHLKVSTEVPVSEHDKEQGKSLLSYFRVRINS